MLNVSSAAITVYSDDLDNPNNLIVTVEAIARKLGVRVDRRTVDHEKAYDGAAMLLAALRLTNQPEPLPEGVEGLALTGR